MIPTIGRIVVYRKAGNLAHPGVPAERLESPAVVTRVLGDGRVNLHVFFDGEGAAIRVSVSQLPETPPRVATDPDWPGQSGWRWPDRA